MAKGEPHNWTLEELQTIWEFDGDDGQTTVTDTARGMGVSHSNWYSIRARLHEAGSPEALYEKMQEAKKHRYNRTSNGRTRVGGSSPQTYEQAVTRVYKIRVSGAGRDSGQEQFTVTIPPPLARAFIASHGSQDIFWEAREDGLLIKAVAIAVPPAPDWLDAGSRSE